MNLLRTLPLLLTLACAVDPTAPTADAAATAKTGGVPGDVEALQAETAALRAQLAEALAAIDALQANAADTETRLAAAEVETLHYNKIKWTYATHADVEAATDDLGDAIADLSYAVYDTDPAGARTSKIDALTIKQKVTENAVGELREATFDTDASGAVTSKIDALTIKQKVTENAVGELRDYADLIGGAVVNMLDAGFTLADDLLGMPALDAASKDATKMTLKFKPEITRNSAAIADLGTRLDADHAEQDAINAAYEAALAPTCGSDFAPRRNIGNVKYEEISFKCGTGMSRLATVERGHEALAVSFADGLAKQDVINGAYEAALAPTCGADFAPRRAIGNLKYEEISFKCGTGMSRLSDVEGQQQSLAEELSWLTDAVGGVSGTLDVVTDATCSVDAEGTTVPGGRDIATGVTVRAVDADGDGVEDAIGVAVDMDGDGVEETLVLGKIGPDDRKVALCARSE